MVLTVLLLAVLFIAGLFNIILFYFPINEIYVWLHQIFPCNADSTASSSPAFERKRDTVYQTDELRKVFATFDKNGDGFITRLEIRESLRNVRILMTDKEIEDIVVKFDSNGDGLIDFDEFCLLTGESMAGQAGDHEREGIDEEGEEENLKEAFDVFDKDNDGLISVEELAFVLTSLGLREGRKIETCKEIIKKVDMDGDGMVNFNEFKRMMMNDGKLVFAS